MKELEEDFVAARKGIYAEDHEGAMDSLDRLFDKLADSLSYYPKDPPKHPNFNTLDLKMMNFRLDELRLMVDDIKLVKQRSKKLFEEGRNSQDKIEVLTQASLRVEDYLVKLQGLCFDVS
jgi:hypothetical protein